MKREAMIHSKNAIGVVEIVKYNSINDIIVITEDGVKCTAVDNPFTGLIYADDKYGVIK